MDRRRLMVGAAASLPSAKALADSTGTRLFTSGGRSIDVEWFAAGTGATAGRAAPAVLLLHGADGLAYGDRYRMAAGFVAGSGYGVGLVHYLDRTGERRVSYATLRDRYPLWTDTVRDAIDWLAREPGVDAGRIGLIGVSLGAALALSAASRDPRVKAIVDYSGPLPEDVAAERPRLPPTLILHGEQDGIVPVSNARDIAALLTTTGTPHEIQTYPGQGHALSGSAQFDAASRTAAFLARYLGRTTA